MFNGKTIESTETCTYGKEDKIESITFHFTDGSNLTVEMFRDELGFSTFDDKSKRTSYIHPNNLVE
ncbi:hypothetical protein PQE75_gp020 [Bacillus phage vB_BcoS-136]|uniref:Uncharacterized protein n=1 Tax=Bacillus phage vB_BcoS-136 TaxID=2419619 RepID=A0A3G3BV87_9CAUD|nr:hypothetical protein PQE75_gp020 [Bacillus phage vB_BcoS-136]AYP68152.1 hypothetical protein vBBcoS136_00020 [Bacillus phage vB_BcoS-136]